MLAYVEESEWMAPKAIKCLARHLFGVTIMICRPLSPNALEEQLDRFKHGLDGFSRSVVVDLLAHVLVEAKLEGRDAGNTQLACTIIQGPKIVRQ